MSTTVTTMCFQITSLLSVVTCSPPRLRARAATVVGVTLMLVATACGSTSTSIVFTSDRDGNLELYSFHVRDQTETNLTNSQADEFSARLSPNKRMVSFLSGTEGATALEVVRIDGTERAAMTQSGAARSTQRWSPNGDRLAFAESRGTTTGIYMATIEGAIVALLVGISLFLCLAFLAMVGSVLLFRTLFS